jgi:hypothetical protein
MIIQKALNPFIFALLLALVSCMGQQEGSSGRRSTASSAQGGSTTADDKPSNEPTFQNSSSAYWFSGGLEIPGSLLINENTTQALYLRGPAVHRFLGVEDNFSSVFCMVISYVDAGGLNKRQLRARALPISFNNFSQSSVERLLRVDITQQDDNLSLCQGTSYLLEANETTPSTSSTLLSTLQAAFSPTQLCPTCSGIIASINTSLYRTSSTGSGLEVRPENWVTLNELDLRGLGLRIDVQSNVTDEAGSCTNSSCSAKGFDCCLQGQCVRDGTERPNAFDQPDYATALIQVQESRNNFLNYPHIFYVCPNIVRQPDIVEPLPDSDADANALFQRNLEDFRCMEEGKKEQPEFALLGIDRCSNNDDYLTIRSSVWSRCGCQADPFPTLPDEPACPNFGLKAITNNAGEIQQVICDIPDDNVEPTPFQILNVSVPNRTAPHRFFDSTGKAHDDLQTAQNVLPVPVQEGESFSYLDEGSKTEPLDTPFNMNSILGPMSISLNKAIPAKVIYVEFDQTYVIAARSGFYTPCPQCAKDSWFQAFSSHPASQRGTGLQAVGYTTSRDTFASNTTNGNYEDTIFGRACWVPPTMLPFSHRAASTLIEQRQGRLETQAALYANGYQRDWFGFNKGALIGSFDGVKWFAIGKGRRVQSTSQRLFLAINAPFADLSENTDTIVEIRAEQSSLDTVAEMDFDTEISLDDPRQNSAGTCQHYHQCNVDRDCVAKLGWEYACAEISRYQTKWPVFDINGNEVVGEEIASANFTRFLQGPFPQDNGKRCVYRGAGSICKRNFTTDLDSRASKHFTCAPNFYCASLGDNSFNDRVVRTPNFLESILFGQAAQVLGRPLRYVGANANLTDTIRTHIEHNAQVVSSIPSDFGICRPGRSLASLNTVEQHRNSDNQRRTDYINQLGSCNSNALDTLRTMSCPAIETRPDQTTPVGDFILSNTPDQVRLRELQNMCGAESQRQLNTGLFESTFKNIEGKTISSLVDLISPSLAADACLRRAGSFCHTDLDCSPNKLHAEQALFFGIESFGGTSAEQRFWSEELVCSQSKPKPFTTSEDYLDYDMALNRCCRETGKDITLYTQVNNLTLAPDIGNDNLGLVTSRLASTDPRANGRYSRYSTVDLDQTAVFPAPRVQTNTTPAPNQWRTISDTGEQTCCGGGMIRKFADGTNDWRNTNRFNFALENLACLNFNNPQVFGYTGVGDENNYNRDYDRLCRSPADGGCVQLQIPQSQDFEVTPPTFLAGSATLSTSPLTPPQTGSPVNQLVTNLVPYQPTPYESNGAHFPMQAGIPPVNFILDPVFSPGTSFYLPIYLHDRAQIISVRIEYFNEDGTQVNQVASEVACPAAGWLNPRESMPDGNHWCIARDGNDRFDVFHARADTTQTVGGDPFAYAGVSIVFRPIGTDAYVTEFPGTARSLNPGNDLYYLTKLSRFELLGIPQIYYEPLYCNLDRDALVPGLFNSSTRAAFETNPVSFAHQAAVTGRSLNAMYGGFGTDNANGAQRVTFQDQVQHAPVFSGHEFKCCTKLGERVTSQDKCCSNFVVDNGDGLRCALPTGVNLSVYFNRFVSTEGVGEDEPNGGLLDDDFIPETGEPKNRAATLDKIAELGLKYCANGEVRFGSTTGDFFAEPFSGFYQQIRPLTPGSLYYSFIDSSTDVDQDRDNGILRFLEGFRWSHHLYCN